MNELQTHLDRIRSDAAECLLLSKLATEEKKALFANMAEHLTNLAFVVENAMAASGTSIVKADIRGEAAASNFVSVPMQQKPRSGRVLPWLFISVAGVTAAAAVWRYVPIEKYLLPFTLQSKHQLSQTPTDSSKQTIAELSIANQGEREVLTDKLGALTARVDSMERAIETLAMPDIAKPSR